MGAEGRKRALSRYSREGMVDATIAVYEHLLKQA